ncbi:tail tube protein [Streptomyces phage BRock]|uniref:Tail protein n=1 Tax=Streptomyces phage BRock TaxID=1913591 RepID=A0A1J0GW41_9CAUD|nr:tail tube protein [Streptomyces phage BRock]APC46399.1 tail protein [Streptomyces phage BRock]
MATTNAAPIATATPSIAHLATDPLRNFKFNVNIMHPNLSGFATLGFMTVSGLNITTEVIPYREGGMNTTTQKMPGQSDFSPITLSQGVAVGKGPLWQWMKQLFTVMQGTGSGTPGKDFRATVDIMVLDHPVTSSRVPVKAIYRVYNAWPTAIAFSDLDAGANAVLMQQVTLAHEGFDYKLAPTIGMSGVSF